MYLLRWRRTMGRAMSLIEVRSAIVRIDDERHEHVRRLLAPLVRSEFDRVRRRNPRLRRIIFGNGMCYIDVDGEKESWCERTAPKYARRLCELADMAADVGINDIEA
jgi:hypothetical protein